MSQQTLVYTDTDYFSRSWGMLTRSQGWLKPVLLLTLVSFVPIFGPLIAMGYAYEWARLTAWGVDSSPKQTGVDVGACLSVGWRVLLVTLCWSFPLGLFFGLVRGLLGTGVLSEAISLAISLLWLFIGVVIQVAALRATIYQQFGAGIGVGRIIEMVEGDYMGLIRIAGISLFGGLVAAIVSSLIMTVGSVGAVPAIIAAAEDIESMSATDAYAIGRILGAMLSALGPALAVTLVVGTFITTLFELVTTNAVGLWMLQYNVPAWGDKNAPLPQQIPPAPPVWNAPSQPVLPASPLMPDQTTHPEQQSSGPTAWVQPDQQLPQGADQAGDPWQQGGSGGDAQ